MGMTAACEDVSLVPLTAGDGIVGEWLAGLAGFHPAFFFSLEDLHLTM